MKSFPARASSSTTPIASTAQCQDRWKNPDSAPFFADKFFGIQLSCLLEGFSHSMMHFILFTTVLSFLLGLSVSHSWLTEPQSTAPRECTIGGSVRSATDSNMRTCAGPCEVGSFAFLQSSSPSSPAARYKRGQTVTIKYNRNNHGPGGFIRLTLVPIDQMMNRKKHAENAFHYSCWGANPVRATPRDIRRDPRFGFNIVGGDGSLHNGPVMFHEANITIPTVVRDGNYVLGWTWYGGIGGSLRGNQPQSPFPFGFFGDYWSCSFVRIEGGPLRSRYNPVFVNDMAHVWPRGCFAANNRLGRCPIEPCQDVRGDFMVPFEFNGRRPRPLTQRQFIAPRCRGERVEGFCKATPTPFPLDEMLETVLTDRFSCKNGRMGG